MEVTKNDILVTENNHAEYTSWYINEDSQVIVDIIKAKKYEYLTDDIHSDKCKYKSFTFNSLYDAYVFILIRYNILPSQFEMKIQDSDGREYTYNRDVAEFVLERL